MKDKSKSISVVGCGWLGLPFSQKMIEQAWSVKGTTTSNSKVNLLKENGIEPYLLKFPVNAAMPIELFKVDFLLINLPPGRGNPNVQVDYPKAIKQLMDSAKQAGLVKKVIFVSSTSVYSNAEELIDEESAANPMSDSGKALLAAEKIISESTTTYVILRFGGLAGPGRHPGRFLAGRTGLETGHQSINFLHLQDAIGVIQTVITAPIKNEIFNIVSPDHPKKSEFYTKMAEDIGLQPPTFIETSGRYKREISVDKFLLQTGYSFLQADPMSFKY